MVAREDLEIESGLDGHHGSASRGVLTRRAFGIGAVAGLLLPSATLSSARAQALSRVSSQTNSALAKPYFSMLLPPEFDAADVGFQGFVVDETAMTIYGQFSTRTKPQQSIIAQYALSAGTSQSPQAIQTPTEAVGHQGLSIEHSQGGPYLWTAGPGYGLGAIRFKFAATGVPRSRSYTLFDASFRRFAISLAVSYDGRWLVASSRKSRDAGSADTVRVFRLADVLASPNGDASAMAIHEWTIPTYPQAPVQGLACDGNYVVVIFGSARPSERKIMTTYSLDGVMAANIPDIAFGRSFLPSGAAYEPEGICFARLRNMVAPALFCGITTGNPRIGRTRDIYLVGSPV
ncbi:MAG: hypothetical protein DI589_25420 [Shinella sp.]|nr:MAG: hypothetical protein DI589_25420 [Shinella sp.]